MSTPNEKTRHYFGEDGILSKTMHYRPRAPQQALAEQVFACMDQADALRGERCAIEQKNQKKKKKVNHN